MSSRPSRLRIALTRVFSILVVASLLLSCNFLSIFNSSSGSSELDFPTDYSAESQASQEQVLLDVMMSAERGSAISGLTRRMKPSLGRVLMFPDRRLL